MRVRVAVRSQGVAKLDWWISAQIANRLGSISFSDVPIDRLTGSGYDPIIDTGELKVCAVRIEAASTALR